MQHAPINDPARYRLEKVGMRNAGFDRLVGGRMEVNGQVCCGFRACRSQGHCSLFVHGESSRWAADASDKAGGAVAACG
jgi:hypothetical protein